MLSWLVPDVGPGAGAPPQSSVLPGEQQVQDGQVRHDLILADIGVLLPPGVRGGGGCVTVAAAVGGPAVGPR